ncbi:hypothetical protein QOK74_08135 [Staphylococcus saprophyticus]|uniref:hypothetical protein n=1 Tax=Staphylococcus saprophyticus TaxID=29385 RepID=UPI0024C40CA9|nr:hypothetical protein [Staphylococcus saprophyticus]MDK1672839.1 hypothetical protein [Staphylococcus saprophyticus]
MGNTIGLLFLGFLFGLTLFTIFYIFDNDRRLDKELSTLRQEFKSLTLNDITYENLKSYIKVRMLDGTDCSRVYENLETPTYEVGGFLEVDDYKLSLDKIISIKEYQIGEAVIDLNGKTIKCEKVILDEFGQLQDIFTSYVGNSKKIEVLNITQKNNGDLFVYTGNYYNLRKYSRR